MLGCHNLDASRMKSLCMLMQPGKLDRSMAAVDLSSERLVNELLNSASKAHTTTSYGVRGAPPYQGA